MRALWLFWALVACGYAQIPALEALDWSPNGEHLLLVSRGHLYWASLAAPDVLYPLYPETHADWVRFGPEGWFLFPAPGPEGFGLWRGFLDGREPGLLWQSPLPLRWPTASADGTRIAFVEDWDSLVILDLETAQARKVLGGAWPKATPEFLPSGAGLLFAGLLPSLKEPSWEIFYLDLATLDLIQLTSDEYFDWCPRISPDGSWIAFVSNRSGNPDIWVQPLWGGPPFPVTEDPWEEAFPCWSPEGGILGYASFQLEGWVFLRTGTH